MANEYAYHLLRAPVGLNDGSQLISHDIQAVYREAGTNDPWLIIAGKHSNFNLPQDQVQTIMDMPDSTGAERSAKNKAYKNLMAQYLNSLQPSPITGFDETSLNEKVTNTDANVATADEVNTYITVTLGIDYADAVFRLNQ